MSSGLSARSLAGTFDYKKEQERARQLDAEAKKRSEADIAVAKANAKKIDEKYPGFQEAMDRGDTAAALESINAAFKADATLEPSGGYQRKFYLLLQRGKADAVNAYSKELMERYPDNRDVFDWVSACTVQTSADEPKFDKNLAFLAAKRSADSAKPDSRWQQFARWRLGWAYYQMGDKQKAIEWVQSALDGVNKLKGKYDFTDLDSECEDAIKEIQQSHSRLGTAWRLPSLALIEVWRLTARRHPIVLEIEEVITAQQNADPSGYRNSPATAVGWEEPEGGRTEERANPALEFLSLLANGDTEYPELSAPDYSRQRRSTAEPPGWSSPSIRNPSASSSLTSGVSKQTLIARSCFSFIVSSLSASPTQMGWGRSGNELRNIQLGYSFNLAGNDRMIVLAFHIVPPFHSSPVFSTGSLFLPPQKNPSLELSAAITTPCTNDAVQVRST